MIDSVDLPVEPSSAPPDLKRTRRRKDVAIDLSKVDRLPPHSIEAEQGVLGCMLLDPNAAIGTCVEKFKSRRDDSTNAPSSRRDAPAPNPHAGASAAFYDLRHQSLYETLVAMYDAKEAIDLITVRQRLKDKGQLDAIGGVAYLTALVDATPSAANLPFYADIVVEKHLLRRMIQTCSSVIGRIYDEEQQGDVESLLDEVEKEVLHISEEREETVSLVMKDLVHKAIAQIEDFHSRQGQTTGIATGFTDLDKMTTGFHGGEMIVIAARPSMGKCLSAASEILLADGRLATIEELFQAKQAALFTVREDFKIVPASPSGFVDDGHKPVFRVTTRLGREVEATQPHPFLTLDGWKPLGELRAGDFIAVPRALPVFGSQARRECEVKLLAYLLGDGCLTRSSPSFTNGNQRIRREFAEAAAEFGGLTVREFDSRGTRTPSLRVSSDAAQVEQGRARFAGRLRRLLRSRRVSARSVALAIDASPSSLTAWQRGRCVPDEGHWAELCRHLNVHGEELADSDREAISANARNPLALWLEKLGLAGADAWQKHLPPPVFTLPRAQLALFLNRLFATDGWASVDRNGAPQIGYATVSVRMARQIQHLLLRFGITVRRRAKRVRYEGEWRGSFQLEVTDRESLSRFASEIGIFGKEEAVGRVRRALSSRRRQTNVDLIPKSIWPRLAAAKGVESWSALARRAGIRGWTNVHVGKRSLSRPRLAQFAQALNNAEFAHLAASDVFWDRVESIEPLGAKQVYDLTIPGTHNFIANDICVHNTSLAMNIAEHVAMDLRLPVGVFSLEMSADSLVLRMLCSRARVNLRDIREGFLAERDFPKLTAVAGKMAGCPLFIDDTAGLSILQLRAKARRMHQQHDVKLFVIDYLQLLRSTAKKAENRQQEIADISQGIKALAKELKVPIIVLAQLNRELEKRGPGEKPKLSDLRESGSIEQDADLVGLLYKPKMGKEDDEDPGEQPNYDAVPVNLLIAKQRNGPTGDVHLTFLKGFTRFENAAKVADEDAPRD
ncbi:MAG: replicative DNA helicase [Limisphaerales bacterium]|nr:MAG: replicative DNA helicase [Limisphaerales bacterium]